MLTSREVGLADTLNCEYQSGGDARTLVNVAKVLMAGMDERDASQFASVASMGGLPLDGEREDLEAGTEPIVVPAPAAKTIKVERARPEPSVMNFCMLYIPPQRERYRITDGQTVTECETWQSLLWNVRRWIDAGTDPRSMKVTEVRP